MQKTNVNVIIGSLAISSYASIRCNTREIKMTKSEREEKKISKIKMFDIFTKLEI